MRRYLFPVALGLAVTTLSLAVGQQPGDPILNPAPVGLPGGVTPAAPAPAVPQLAAPAQPERPVNPFPITADAGAWVICAATYMGPDAPELARQVAVELREKHRLAAYIFNHADQERIRQREEFEQLKARYPGVPMRRRTVRRQEQCAVLVGGFKDVDAASAQLKAVKALPLPKLELPDGRPAYDRQNLVEPDNEKKQMVVKQAVINPFTNAMVVRNPAAPAPKQEQPKFDPFWKELNADEEYSLLRNRSRYTLVVKEYLGATVVQSQQGKSSGFMNLLGLGSQKPGEGLNAAALQAHELAKLLRNPRLGFTSYVLHTRNSSLVTVGGFDRLDDPELNRLQQQITQLKFSTSKGGQQDPIGLMANPAPMEVPRP